MPAARAHQQSSARRDPGQTVTIHDVTFELRKRVAPRGCEGGDSRAETARWIAQGSGANDPFCRARLSFSCSIYFGLGLETSGRRELHFDPSTKTSGGVV
jgi:hypothetical protein